MDPITILASPKYAHIKNTYEIFDTRLNLLKERRTYLKALNNLAQVKIIRSRVWNLLKSHKLYNELDFHLQKKSDPINGEIPFETLKALLELSKPRSRDLRFALRKVNQMIRIIKNDHYFQENKHKMKRYDELLEHRRKICCMLAKYKFVADSPMCYRFAPCTKKIIDVLEIPIENKPNSRMLRFDFDDRTNKLAYPHYKKLQSAIQFFIRLKQINQLKVKENVMMTKDEVLQIETIIQSIKEKIEFLQKIEKNMIDDGIIPQKAKAESTGGVNKKTFQGFTNPLAIPRRKRLENSLIFYDQYLNELLKRKFYEKKIANTGNSKIKPLRERMERNISFSQNLLKELPDEKQHCWLEEKIISRKKIINLIYNDTGNVVRYNFDEKTNQLAAPKLAILEAALKVQLHLLENFENDLKNVGKLCQSNESKDDDMEEEGSEKRNSRSDHENIKARLSRLTALISERKESSDQNEKARDKNYHESCLTVGAITFPPTKYKSSKPYKNITISGPSIRTIQSSIKAYERWIEKNDVLYENKLKSVLKRYETSSLQEIDDRQSSDRLEWEKIPRHTRRMLENKMKLENTLKNFEIDEEIHFQTHEKLDCKTESFKTSSASGIDIERLIQLAKPKSMLLRTTISKYSHLMSPHKRGRLSCRLKKPLTKPEQVEQIRREQTARKPKRSSKNNDKILLNKLFSRILHLNYTMLDELIMYSILNASNMRSE